MSSKLLVANGLPYCMAISDTYLETVFTSAGEIYNYQNLPDDVVGLATVTFTGVSADSEIRVYKSNGDELAGIESCASNQVLSWYVYQESNQVTIRIVHSSYKIKQFEYTAVVGSQSLPIQQEVDKWYTNPA